MYVVIDKRSGNMESRIDNVILGIARNLVSEEHYIPKIFHFDQDGIHFVQRHSFRSDIISFRMSASLSFTSSANT